MRFCLISTWPIRKYEPFCGTGLVLLNERTAEIVVENTDRSLALLPDPSWLLGAQSKVETRLKQVPVYPDAGKGCGDLPRVRLQAVSPQARKAYTGRLSEALFATPETGLYIVYFFS